MFAKNLKYLREKNAMEQTELAHRLGRKSSSSISEWEKGKYTPKIGVINDIAEIFKVSISDLMDSDLSTAQESTLSKITDISSKLEPPRQEKVYNFAEEQLEEQNSIIENNVVEIPKKIINGRSTAAGEPIDGDTQDVEASTMIVEQTEIPNGADEIVTIAGDSMEPTYENGSQVFVHWQPSVEQGEVAIVSIVGDGVTCKKIYYDWEEGEITLRSINDKYEDRIFSMDEIRVIGKVL